ncbi:MAG: site-specific integrase [Verrucomicrobiota bacterium]
MSKPKFPIAVKRGHITVKIYKTPTRGCKSFTVVHHLGDKRQRRYFTNLDLAVTAAETTANALSTGELNVLELKNDDRLSYVRALETLKPTGQPLDVVASQYAQAFKILEGGDIIEAARFYAKRHPSMMPQKTVPEVIGELLLAKDRDGVSDVYLKDLKGRLGRFEKKFKGLISLVTEAEIATFLQELENHDKQNPGTTKPLSGKSRNNYRRAIGTLFKFAEARGFLPRGVVEFKSVAMAREEHTDIEIFRPAELALLLETANPALIPFLTIGAFAGLRHAELQRLDWSEVRLEDGFIEVKASKAKTASRRLVPIPDNLKLWLKDHAKAGGPICDYANMSKQLLWLSEAVDKKLKETDASAVFVWKHNALRHSYISYRVAQIQNVAQVALEAGNSPRVVFANYRELVRPDAAKAWFAIVPAKKVKG